METNHEANGSEVSGENLNTPLYVFADLQNLSHIQAPLRSTNRIKFTCFTVSPKFLVFGATSGGLYIFKREPCTFLQLIPSKDGAVSRVSLSPGEGLVAAASCRGVVSVWDLSGGRRVQNSQEHTEARVTAFTWALGEDELLYIGDDLGRVSLCCPHSFSAKSLFQGGGSAQLMQLDSAVVQLHWQRGLLLISTLSRCYLSDTSREHYKQVGHKLRDGEFGACFLLAREDGSVRAFCARPGARLWEVRDDGIVLSTHQFKPALVAAPPSAIITPKGSPEDEPPRDDGMPVTFNFAQLYPIANRFLFTFRSSGSIYVLDPDCAGVVAWTELKTPITDAQVCGDTVYVWHAGGGELRALSLTTLERCLLRLYLRQQFPACAELCSNHLTRLMPAARRLSLLCDLGERVAALGLSELCQRLQPLTTLLRAAQPPAPSSIAQKLSSGIVRVANNHAHLQEQQQRVLGRARRLSERSRSLSSSPEPRRRQRRSSGDNQVEDLARQASLRSLQEMQHEHVRRQASRPAIEGWEHRFYSSQSFRPTDVPFSVLTSPEAVAAMRDLTHALAGRITSGTKTLRHRWHALEGKFRALSLDSAPPPLDVGTAPQQLDNPGPSSPEPFLVNNGTPTLQPPPVAPEAPPPPDLGQVRALCQQILESSGDSLDASFYVELLLELSTAIQQRHALGAAPQTHWLLQYELAEPFPLVEHLQAAEIQTLGDAVHWLLREGRVVDVLGEWLGEQWEDEKGEEELSEVLRTRYSAREQRLDVLTSRLLAACWAVVKPENVLQDLIAGGGCCVRGVWRAVRSSQTAVLGLISRESHEALRKSVPELPPPQLLATMMLVLQASTAEGLEVFLNLGSHLPPRLVAYLTLRLQPQTFSTAALLSYLATESSHQHVDDAEVFELGLDAYISLNSAAGGGACACGFPLPGSAKCGPQLFSSLGERLLSLLRQREPQRHTKVCRQLGMWPEILAEQQRRGEVEASLVQLVAQLDSVEATATLGLSQEAWTSLLSLRAQLEGGAGCLGCGAPLPSKHPWSKGWSELGMLMVQQYGAEVACDTLLEHAPSASLQLGFYRACILSEVVNREGGEVPRLQLLQRINKPATLPPFSQEVSGIISEALLRDLSPQGATPSPLQAPLEGPWGVRTRLRGAPCPRCLLPLSDPVLLARGGVRVGRCGHAAHTTCGPPCACSEN